MQITSQQCGSRTVAVTCYINFCGLVTHPLSISLTIQWGQTPLVIAAEEGHSETVDVLVTAKANLNVWDKVG